MAGLYNGLAVMEDVQTRSYWDHVTGECIHGPLRGQQLPRVTHLRYFPARAVEQRYPNARLALSRPGLRQRVLQRVVLRRMLSDEGHLPFMFSASMAQGDTRRPAMELGLGVWWPGASRFYPMERLRAQGGAVIDTLGDRRVLVFVDPVSHSPVAGHTQAHDCRWQGEDLLLDTKEIIRDLHQLQPDGSTHPLELLPQLFTRWYGFAATFPGCELYEP